MKLRYNHLGESMYSIIIIKIYEFYVLFMSKFNNSQNCRI